MRKASPCSAPSAEWLEQAKLVSDREFSGYFGQAIAIDGDTAVVGEPNHYVPSHKHGGKGAAYIYTRSGDTWSLQAKLLVPENQADSYNFFGSSVAIDGNTVLIGAHVFARGNPSTPLYIFTRSRDTWSMHAQPTLPNPPKFAPSYNSVALDGDLAVAGAAQHVDVFRRHPNTGNWFYETELKPDKEDPSSSDFGGAVAIDGNTIVIGGGKYSRKAYVFVRDSNTGKWFQQAELSSNVRVGFGAAVAIFGNTAVVGSPREDCEKGSAYVFERDPAKGIWLQQAKLAPNDVPMFFSYGFGASVAIDDHTIVVGVSSSQTSQAILQFSWDKTKAYVFVRHPGTSRWSQQAKLLPHDYEIVAQSYGHKVGISGDQVIVSNFSGHDAASPHHPLLPTPYSLMFLYLSKLLPLFLYPLGLACVLMVVALVTLWKRPRIAAASIATALIVLLIGGNNWAAYSLVRSLEWQNIPPAELPNAEAIVILGGATKPALPPRPFVDLSEQSDRVFYAAQLYRQKKAPLVIVSGGRIDWFDGGGPPESVDIAAILGFLGVPAAAILQDPDSLNTYQNAVNVKKILDERGIRQVLLVTSAIHMPRSLPIFKRQGIDAIPAPTDFLVSYHQLQSSSQTSLLNILPQAKQLQDFTSALKEYVGLFVYRLRGWL